MRFRWRGEDYARAWDGHGRRGKGAVGTEAARRWWLTRTPMRGPRLTIGTPNGHQYRRVQTGGRRNLFCSWGSGVFRRRRAWWGAGRHETDRERPVRELPRRSCYAEICDCTLGTSTSNWACLRLAPWSFKSDDCGERKDATRRRVFFVVISARKMKSNFGG
jgi:hypothetical protein